VLQYFSQVAAIRLAERVRKWFYKWKKRRDKEGDEGLRLKIRRAPKMPNKVPEEIEKEILNFVKEYPAYGLERIEEELKSTGIFVRHSGIYNVLKRKGLNRAKNRLEWVRKLSGEIVTRDERVRDKEKSKTNHIQAWLSRSVSKSRYFLPWLHKRDR
jgi:transposase